MKRKSAEELRDAFTFRLLSVLFALCCYSLALPAWMLRDSNTSIGGYIEVFPFVIFPPSGDSTGFDNLLQFRLNNKWYLCSSLTIEADGRLLAYAGNDFRSGADIAAELRQSPSFLDMLWAQGKNGVPFVFSENIDRAYAELTLKKLTVTAGRQRINWGTNLIWNPCDWFNAYNFLDFSYPERPGSDALRLQYYTSTTSVVEIALQEATTAQDRTFAGLYKFNVRSWDWQVQAGLSGLDAAAGFSWAGQIEGAGFRGELSGYIPALDRSTGNENFVGVAALSADYTFTNSLYLLGEALYNGFGTSGYSSPLSLSTFSRVTAQSLIPKRYALFGEASYPVTPLLTVALSSSVSPEDGSLFLAPSITWSIIQNLEITLLSQLFFGWVGELYGGASDLVSAKLQFSF